MKIIALQTGSTAPFKLCDHGRDGPNAWLPVPVRKVDVLSFVQGAFSKPKNRGNTLLQVRFTVSKVHDSFTAAQLYLMDINSLVPTQGPIRIDFEDQVTTRLVPDATIEVTPLPILGVRTTLSYTIKYGCETVDGVLITDNMASTAIMYDSVVPGNTMFYNNSNLFPEALYSAATMVFISEESTPFNGTHSPVGVGAATNITIPNGTFIAADVDGRTFGIYPVI